METEESFPDPVEKAPSSGPTEYSCSSSLDEAPPTFDELIDYFTRVELMRGFEFPVPHWREKLFRARDGVDLSEAFKTAILLFHVLDQHWGHHALSMPTQILAEGSKYGMRILCWSLPSERFKWSMILQTHRTMAPSVWRIRCPRFLP